MVPRRAYSLVELLVVIAIAAVLMALTLVGVQRVRGAAAKTACANNLRQVGLACLSYHSTYGRLPAGCSYQDGKAELLHLAWTARILPHVEQQSLWDQIGPAYKRASFFEDPPHLPILATVVPTFTCPADGRVHSPLSAGTLQVGTTSYLGVSGIDLYTTNGLLYVDSAVRLADITDGASNTIMIGERPPSGDGRLGWWYAGWGQDQNGTADSVLGVRELYIGYLVRYPSCERGPFRFRAGRVSNECDAFHFWSLHAGGANFAFADGSVRFLAYSADAILPVLATRAGGEVVALPD